MNASVVPRPYFPIIGDSTSLKSKSCGSSTPTDYFIVQALKGEPITTYDDEFQTRSFCYVDYLIEGMVRLMEVPGAFTGPVDIGSPGEFTMLELAERVVKLSGSSSKIVFHPLPQDDLKQRQSNVTLAKEKLNWVPYVQLEKDLEKTISRFRKLIANG